MKFPVGGLIIFVSGVGAGFIVGKIFGEKRAFERCDKELADMKKHYDEKTELYKEAIEKKKDAEVRAIVLEDNLKNAEKAEEKLKSAVEKDKEIYDKQITDYTSFSDTEKPKATIIQPEIKDTKTIISYDEFIDETDFNEETLIYYTWDNVLADSYDEVVSADAYVGISNLELFDRAKEGDTMYVRNTDLEEVLEIIFKDASYAEEVGKGPGGVK